MALTKQLISDIAADMAAEQAYYKRLHTLIECAKHTGAPIPQVRPFPGRTAACVEFAPAATPRHSPEPFGAWGAGGLNGAQPRAGAQQAPRRGGWAAAGARSFREAIGRFLHPVKHNGPVL